MSRHLIASGASLTTLCLASIAQAQEFTYQPPGQLVSGSGTGREDEAVYVPDMRFPIEEGPAYPNSQVWGVGGSSGPAGGQCDTRNYSYPWWDNYCETRTWDVPLCPGGKGHQGQDIRPTTCVKDVHWAVAAEAGRITEIGTYSVSLVADNGTRHRYLHMEPSSLTVSVGDTVTQGQRLGRVSNAFGATPTTIHLHYDIFQTVEGVGPGYVPTYMSLVRAYERLIGQQGRRIEQCQSIIGDEARIIDDRDDCFELRGNLQFWRTVNDAGYDGRLYWTYAYTNANPGSWARWQLRFMQAGRYQIEVYLEPDYAQSQEARYRVQAAGQAQEVRLDMSAGGGWRELGAFDFVASSGQWLDLLDNTGEASTLQRRMSADAIRVTPLSSAPMDDPPDMQAPVDMPPDLPPAMTPDMDAPAQDQPDARPDLEEEPPPRGESSVSTSTCASAPRAAVPSPPGALAIIITLALGAVIRRERRS